MPDELTRYIAGIPKAELHVHIEGTLEPELLLELARKNGVSLPFGKTEEVRAAYRFTDLQSFLDLYYAATAVLRTEEDFYRLTLNYMKRAASENIRHAEIFFDPQAHTERGIPFEAVLAGIVRALSEAGQRWKISSGLILCFLRHLSEESAEQTLDAALEHRDTLLGVGLDSSEKGHPPGKFARVFRRAADAGLIPVAHAGEEGPPDYIRGALEELGARRIDHGVRCLEDPELVERLARERIPLTLCPLSNVRLGVVRRLQDHPLPRMLDAGLHVCLNSDDPAYFGGYLSENFLAVQRTFALGRPTIDTLAKNAFEASFLDERQKGRYLSELSRYADGFSGDKTPDSTEGDPP